MWYFIYEFLESYFSKNSIYSFHCMTIYFVYIFPIYVSMNLVSIIYHHWRYGKLRRPIKLILARNHRTSAFIYVSQLKTPE